MKLLLLIGIYLLAGCDTNSGFTQKFGSIFSSKKEDPGVEDASKAKESSNFEADLGDVEFFEVKKSDLKNTIRVRGKVQASEKIEVRADRNIKVGAAKFANYSEVKKGDVLFEVDTTELVTQKTELQERLDQIKLELATSQTQLEFARKQYERKRLLSEKGIVAQKELEETENLYKTALNANKTKEIDLKKGKRELELAAASVKSANILSPLNGTLVSVAEGATDITQGQVLATVANSKNLSLYVTVSDSAITQLVNQLPVDIALDVVPGKLFKARIHSSKMLTTPSPVASVFEVRIDFSSEQIKNIEVKDGFEGEMRAQFAKKENVITIPKAALIKNGSDLYVLASGSKSIAPSSRPVTVGVSTALEVEIIDGLEQGEFVAVKVGGAN